MGTKQIGSLLVRISGTVNEFQKSLAEAQKMVSGFGNRMNTIGRRLSVISAPMAAIAGGALKMAADFESSMNKVSALGDITGGDLKKLQDQALELGAKTQFSAKEAADGMADLAAAGFDTTKIMASMPGILDLAAAAQVGVARASEIAVSTMGAFHIAAGQSGEVADILASASARGVLSIEDLAESLKYVGPVAFSVGRSLEETAAAISLLSNAGIKGSQAGTALRMGMIRFIKPTKQAREVISELGLQLTDGEGRIRPLVDIVQQLSEKHANLAHVTKLVGVEAATSWMALVNQGAPALAKLTAEIDKDNGAADRMATTLRQGLAGGFERMKGSVETAGIALGMVLAPAALKVMAAIESLANSVTELSIKFGTLPNSVQLVVGGFAGLLMILGPLILAIGFASKAFLGLISVLRLGLTSIGLLVTPIGAVGVAIAALAALAVTVYQNWEPLKAFFGPIFAQWQDDFRNGLAILKGEFESWQSDFLNGLDIIKSKMSSWGGDFNNGIDVIKMTFIDAKNAIVQTASEIYEGVKMWLVDKMADAFNAIGEKVKTVYTYFADLKADLLDHSPVPDIQKGVTDAFNEMGANITSATGESTGKIKQDFDSLATNVGNSATKIGEHGKRLTGHIKEIQSKITDIFDDRGVIRDPLQEQIEGLIRSNNVEGLKNLAAQFSTNSEKAKIFRDALKEAESAVKKADRSIGELSANGGKLSSLLSELSGLFNDFGGKFAKTFGLSSEFGSGISDFLTSLFTGKASDGIGGAFAEILGNLFGSGGTAEEQIKSVAKGFDDFLGEIFGNSGSVGEAVATGIDGSVVYANNSIAGLSDTFGVGISKAMGYAGAILDTVDAIQKLGKTTKDTVAGVTEIAGTAIGSIWGPAGAQVGNQIGAMVGNLIGGLFGGASTNPDTKAREQVQKFLEDKLGKNVVFGSDKRFNQPGWADSFNQTENAGSFAALGEGLKNFLGITEDIGPQIGAILSEYVKGNLDDARMLVSQLGIGLEDMQKGLLAQAEAGKISWHDYNVQMADLNKLYEKGRVGLGDLKGAMDAYIKSGGKGAEAVKAAQDIAIEAIEKGAKTFEEAKQKLIAEGYDPGMVNAIFDAAAQRGIKNLEQMKNASKETLGAIVGDSYALSGALAKQWDEMKSQLQEIQTTMNSIPDKTEKSFVFTVDMSDEDRQLLADLKENGGAPPTTTTTTTQSGTVQKYATGGIVNRSTSFLNNGNPALMGEKGAEAILPLKRVGNVLGVNASGMKGSQNLTLVVNAQGAANGVEESIRRVVRDMGEDIVKRAVQTTVSMYKRGAL